MRSRKTEEPPSLPKRVSQQPEPWNPPERPLAACSLRHLRSLGSFLCLWFMLETLTDACNRLWMFPSERICLVRNRSNANFPQAPLTSEFPVHLTQSRTRLLHRSKALGSRYTVLPSTESTSLVLVLLPGFKTVVQKETHKGLQRSLGLLPAHPQNLRTRRLSKYIMGGHPFSRSLTVCAGGDS